MRFASSRSRSLPKRSRADEEGQPETAARLRAHRYGSPLIAVAVDPDALVSPMTTWCQLSIGRRPRISRSGRRWRIASGWGWIIPGGGGGGLFAIALPMIAPAATPPRMPRPQARAPSRVEGDIARESRRRRGPRTATAGLQVVLRTGPRSNARERQSLRGDSTSERQGLGPLGCPKKRRPLHILSLTSPGSACAHCCAGVPKQAGARRLFGSLS